MRPVAVVMVDVDAEHLLKLSARALIEEIVEGVQALGDSLLEHAAPGLLDDFAGAYGVEPATLWCGSNPGGDSLTAPAEFGTHHDPHQFSWA